MRSLTTRPLALLAALAVAGALAGCAGGDEVTTTPGGAPETTVPETTVPETTLPETTAPATSAPAADPSALPVRPVPAELTVVVDDGSGTATTSTLTCEPTGGDVATAQAACDQIAQTGAAAFAPVPPDTMCTQQFGGPQTATVTGTLAGQPVEAEFSRTDGCQIGRWDALSALLGEVAGADS